MSARERLIEILRQPIFPHELVDPIEAVADYLLDNGVIVLPCKIGEQIYYIDRNTNIIRTDTVKYLTITRSGIKPILEHHNIRFWDYYKWGKNVFPSKEDAEVVISKMETLTNADHCVCCGAIIPEGQMVCPNCLVVVKEG